MTRIRLRSRFRAGGAIRAWADEADGPLAPGDRVEAWDDDGVLDMRVVRVIDSRVVLADWAPHPSQD